VRLFIEQLHPIQWNKKAFDQLVLEKRTKELVKALVKVRISTERMEDVIEGKGNGLIMLLHGSPGTGKTLTAGMFLLVELDDPVNNINRKVSPFAQIQESNIKHDDILSVSRILQRSRYTESLAVTLGQRQLMLRSICRPFFTLERPGTAVSPLVFLEINLGTDSPSPASR
jgi:hypothetical protein